VRLIATDGRLIAIGDVHGCVHALDALLEAIAPQPADRLVFLGDLIDQGRDSAEVIDRILQLSARCQVIVIQGNHEEMLQAARESEQALRYWEHCGGVNTLNSYRFGGSLKDIPGSHWNFLAQCRPYYETDDVIFTHANYTPELPMMDQPEHSLRWDLFEPAEMQPHVSGKRVIVGHTEQDNSEILDLGFAVCIDTACWRHGWLTALDVDTGQVWQASRFGQLRDPGEMHQRGRYPKVPVGWRE
jgi:serine/threonine protein phosphatase 1